MKITLGSVLNRKKTVHSYRSLLKEMLLEDAAASDLTARLSSVRVGKLTAEIKAKAGGVAAGLAVAGNVFRVADRGASVGFFIKDGDRVRPGDVLMRVKGRSRALLAAERPALNMLSHLSGIATLASKMTDRLKGTKAVLLDTRKTLPGLRYLEKYAVTAGGGKNHRLNLKDGILIKENHIAAAGGLAEAVKSVLVKKPFNISIEVEVENIRQLQEALDLPVDVIMLDNFSMADMRKAVRMAAGNKRLEVSGNVSLRNIRRIAKTGVDYISAGVITHSAPALDISMLVSGKKAVH